MMERYNQGLDLKSSKEMFLFSICETVFMSSMAMSYFYSWQTYSVSQDSVSRKSLSGMSSAEKDRHRPEVVEVSFRDVLF